MNGTLDHITHTIVTVIHYSTYISYIYPVCLCSMYPATSSAIVAIPASYNMNWGNRQTTQSVDTDHCAVYNGQNIITIRRDK